MVAETMEVLQMVLPDEITPPAATIELISLSAANAAEMVALTNLAFPGFFRNRTHEMGAYYGVRSEGKLIAMGGERLVLEGYSEISGICTHPAHRGKSLAASLIWQLVRNHRRDGIVSWLHVSATNQRAIELYLRLGFKVARKIDFNRVSRRAEI
jgi:predicted GNAT family acetyltransferase